MLHVASVVISYTIYFGLPVAAAIKAVWMIYTASRDWLVRRAQLDR